MVEALACKAGLSGFESHRYLQFPFDVEGWEVTVMLDEIEVLLADIEKHLGQSAVHIGPYFASDPGLLFCQHNSRYADGSRCSPSR